MHHHSMAVGWRKCTSLTQVTSQKGETPSSWNDAFKIAQLKEAVANCCNPNYWENITQGQPRQKIRRDPYPDQ
jgi:hypothetical protein